MRGERYKEKGITRTRLNNLKTRRSVQHRKSWRDWSRRKKSLIITTKSFIINSCSQLRYELNYPISRIIVFSDAEREREQNKVKWIFPMIFVPLANEYIKRIPVIMMKNNLRGRPLNSSRNYRNHCVDVLSIKL